MAVQAAAASAVLIAAIDFAISIGMIDFADSIGMIDFADSIGMIDFSTTTSTTSSLSVTSAFHGGGAGVGVRGGAGVGAGDIRTMGMATATHTVTAMATRMGDTPAAIMAARATEMTIPPIQEWPSCKAALRGLGTIMVPLMESWDLGREARFARTSATMAAPVWVIDRQLRRQRAIIKPAFEVIG
jgi:hypothetical protein